MTRDVKMDAQMGVSKEGYAGRIEVVAGPTGRRRRSEAEKARIAAESLTPNAIVADIARRYGATRWQIYEFIVPRASQILDVELSRDILAQPDEQGAVHARVNGHHDEIVDRRIELGIVPRRRRRPERQGPPKPLTSFTSW